MIIIFKLFSILTFIFPQIQNKYNYNDIFEKNGILYQIKNNQKINGEVYTIINEKSFLMGLSIEGRKHGLWKTSFKDGQRLEENFNNGIVDGSMTLILKNGQKKWRHTFKNGIKDGLTTYWHHNGEKLKEGNYVNGDSIGIWNYWDKNGELVNQKRFRKRKKSLNYKSNTYIYKEDIIN